MKPFISLNLFVLIVISSCNTSPKPQPQQKDVPKALTEKDGSFGIVSKRNPDDLVESLYNELADKSPALKDLEFKIDQVQESKRDSIESFNEFNGKNNSFYNSANNQIGRMNDSVLKEKVRILIESSVKQYDISVQPYHDLLKSVDQKTATLNDLHTILKITRTLPVIEKYQKESRPGIQSIKGYTKQLDEVIKITDTLIKK